MGRRAAAVALALACVAACGPPSEIALTHHMSGGGPGGLVSGMLAVDQQGCLVVDYADVRYVLVLPSTYTVGRSDGRVVVMSEDGGVLSSVGEHVTAGGGAYHRPELEAVAPVLGIGLAGACAHGDDFWLATDLSRGPRS